MSTCAALLTLNPGELQRSERGARTKERRCRGTNEQMSRGWVHLPEFINHLAGIALGLISFNGFNGKNDSLSRNPSGVRTMLSAFQGGSGSLDSKARRDSTSPFSLPFCVAFPKELMALRVIYSHFPLLHDINPPSVKSSALRDCYGPRRLDH